MAIQSGLVTLVPVRNMDRAIRFFTKKLGAKLVERGRGEMRNSWAGLELSQTWVWLIKPGKQEKRTLAYSTFLVKNIRRFVGGLKQKGVRFQRAERIGPQTRVEGPIAYDSFGASAFFKDSEGNLWMVWQNFPPM